MTGSSHDRRQQYSYSSTGTAARHPVQVSDRRSGQHRGSVARAGGRAIDPLAVLASVRATLREFGDTGFDAATFVAAYGRARGREVKVEEASLARRGVLAETWVCEFHDVIRVDRQLVSQRRDMVILVQWANIHYHVEPGVELVARFDVLAEAVALHNAVAAPTEIAPVVGC